jgi:penicillin amidase
MKKGIRVSLVFVFLFSFCSAAHAGQVTIFRDNYGIPQIFGKTIEEVFYGYGYALAQDRLFQMEILRRSYYGMTAEIYGTKMKPFDIAMRTNNLTRSEIDSQMETHLKAEHKKALSSMAQGMNRYIDEASKDRVNLLPKEFHQYGFAPEKWTPTDLSAVFLSIMGIFMDVSNEHRNLDALKHFIKLHGPQKGKEIFNDWAWINDPGAYTTVPNEITASLSSSSRAGLLKPRIEKLLEESRITANAREELFGGLSSGGFSYCVVVDSKKSATGHPILMGGPQFMWQSPSALYEVGLHGGGLDVIGSTLVGYPSVMFGHTRRTAFSSTAGLNNIVDHYEEKLNPTNKYQYWYKGVWKDMEKKEEVIKVKGEKDEVVTIYKTVHGPVFAWGEGVAYSKKLSCRDDYLLGMASFYEVMKAKSVQEFRKAAEIGSMTVNQYYADADGNIAYFHQGKNPIRPPGLDVRIPSPGTGEFEWLGFISRSNNPFVKNPSQGFIVNWNNKPANNWANGDISSGFGSAASWGEENRVQWIEYLIRKKDKISVEDMKEMIREISDGHIWAFSFKKFLIDAIDKEGGDDPDLKEAKRFLMEWDDRWRDNDNNGFYDSPGLIIFQNWWGKALKNTFQDEFGDYAKFVDDGSGPFAWDKRKRYVGQPLFLRALKGDKAAVPLSKDYFEPKGRDKVLVESLKEAISDLKAHFQGAKMAEWGNRTIKADMDIPQTTLLRAPSSLGPALKMPMMERGTENHIVELRKEGAKGVNVTPHGASGFVKADGSVNKHYDDQLKLFNRWEYKPMLFDRKEIEKISESKKVLNF